MGRLIDADDFFERMKNDIDLCAEMEMCGEEALKKYLDLQPTAYNVDKVVEQLESLRNAEADYYYAGSNDVIDREDAIKIVKGGGVDA